MITLSGLPLAIIVSLCILFIKSLSFGIDIQEQLAEKYNNKYYRKNKSKNFFERYFYINFRKEISPFLFWSNMILPIVAVLNVLIWVLELFIEQLYPIAVVSEVVSILVLFLSTEYLLIGACWKGLPSERSTLKRIILILLLLLNLFAAFLAVYLLVTAFLS